MELVLGDWGLGQLLFSPPNAKGPRTQTIEFQATTTMNCIVYRPGSPVVWILGPLGGLGLPTASDPPCDSAVEQTTMLVWGLRFRV